MHAGEHQGAVGRPPSRLGLKPALLQQCLHCGMCLSVCPTYAVSKLERHGPRGRIALAAAVDEGRLPLTPVVANEFYYCLGCLSCTSACPAGVDYATIFEEMRARAESSGVIATPERRFWRWLALRAIFTRPRLLRVVGHVLRFYQRSGAEALARRLGLMRLLPLSLRKLEPQLPRIAPVFSDALIGPEELPPGTPRFRVGLLTGCVQDLLLAQINRDTADVLLANGCAVLTPRCQPCCGSLHAHNGDLEAARSLARRLLDAFDLSALDAVISNAGGCGSHLRRFGHLLADDPAYKARAEAWDAKLFDIHAWLARTGLAPFPAPAAGQGSSSTVKVAYQDSCHLRHAQGVVNPPRDLLRSIPGLQLLDLPGADTCCGSAGIYSITHPDLAAALRDKKLERLKATGATCLAVGNPGCHLHLAQGLAATGSPIPVEHPVSLLARAYRGQNPGPSGS